jgi:hypothetical protein
MLRLLLLILHHVTVGGHGHHLLLLVTENVVTRMPGEVGAHLLDVVACLQCRHLILAVYRTLLAASTLEGGAQVLLQGKEVQALVVDEGVLHLHLHPLNLDAEVQVMKGEGLENMQDDQASAGVETANQDLLVLDVMQM